jgi:hypothetical protein
LYHGARFVLKVAMLSLGWIFLFRLNSIIFAALELTPRATLIFLPAALRVLYPLVFRHAGIAALLIGSFLVLPDSEGTLLHRLTLAGLSTLAPVIGIVLCRTVRPIRLDLAGLTPADLFSLSIVCAVAHSLLLNAYLIAVGYPLQPLAHLLTVFVGDVLGTLIVLFGVATALSFVAARNHRR